MSNIKFLCVQYKCKIRNAFRFTRPFRSKTTGTVQKERRWKNWKFLKKNNIEGRIDSERTTYDALKRQRSHRRTTLKYWNKTKYSPGTGSGTARRKARKKGVSRQSKINNIAARRRTTTRGGAGSLSAHGTGRRENRTESVAATITVVVYN